MLSELNRNSKTIATVKVSMWRWVCKQEEAYEKRESGVDHFCATGSGIQLKERGIKAIKEHMLRIAVHVKSLRCTGLCLHALILLALTAIGPWVPPQTDLPTTRSVDVAIGLPHNHRQSTPDWHNHVA